MAITPSDFFGQYYYLEPGDTVPENIVGFALGALDGLGAPEADPTGGDARKVALAVAQLMHKRYQALATKPTRMTTTESTPTGVSAGIIRKSYTTTFDLSIVGTDMADEPT